MTVRGTMALVANASRARLYHVVSDGIAPLDTFEHPESRLKEAELGADRPGRMHDEGPSGQRTAFDPTTALHEVELTVFARELAGYVERRLASQSDALDLVICAPPKFLGLLRDHLGPASGRHLRESIAHDYTGLDEAALLATLRNLGVKGTRARV